jgi:phosphatidylinositol glycan class V
MPRNSESTRSESSRETVIQTHKQQLLLLSLFARLCSLLLIALSSRLPLFDSSPGLVSSGGWASALLRWDAFHFAHVADSGYIYEYEWAFFPGTPLVMRLGGWAIRLLKRSDSWNELLLSGALAALACDTTRLFYCLSLHHLQSPSLAFLASILSLLPSSPVTLRFAPYSEPFFTYLSYKGK